MMGRQQAGQLPLWEGRRESTRDHSDLPPTAHTNSVLLNTCTHTHVPLLAPNLGGKRQKTPVTLHVDPVCVCHLRPYKLVCQQEDSGQALRDLLGLLGEKGTLGELRGPRLCHHLCPERFCIGAGQREGA